MTKVFRDGVPIDCEVAGAPPMTADPKPQVVKELEDLIQQATTERSHYYVKSVCEKAILAIGMLKSENSALRAEVERLKSEFHQTRIIGENEKAKQYKELCDRLTARISQIQKALDNHGIGPLEVLCQIREALAGQKPPQIPGRKAE
jgi:hypothetical protein